MLELSAKGFRIEPMKTRLGALILFLFTSPALAQQEIDLFEGQDELPTKALSVSDVSGQEFLPSIEGADSSAAPPQGTITIMFEKQDTSILVPVKIRGKDAYFLFDTGATYTTVSSAFAKSVGSLPPKDGPSLMLQTANGQRQAQMGILDNFSLGGRVHNGVSYVVCDSCPAGMYKGKPIVGLLGRNVIGRYRYSIDEGLGKITMIPATNYSDRIRDIENWLSIEKSGVEKSEFERAKFVVELKNRAPKSITSVEVVLECTGNEISLGRTSIPSRQTRKFESWIKYGECNNPSFSLRSPTW